MAYRIEYIKLLKEIVTYEKTSRIRVIWVTREIYDYVTYESVEEISDNGNYLHRREQNYRVVLIKCGIDEMLFYFEFVFLYKHM